MPKIETSSELTNWYSSRFYTANHGVVEGFEQADYMRLAMQYLGDAISELYAAEKAGESDAAEMLCDVLCGAKRSAENWFKTKGLPADLWYAEYQVRKAKEAENGRDGTGDAGCEGSGDAGARSEACEADG